MKKRYCVKVYRNVLWYCMGDKSNNPQEKSVQFISRKYLGPLELPPPPIASLTDQNEKSQCNYYFVL